MTWDLALYLIGRDLPDLMFLLGVAMVVQGVWALAWIVGASR